MYSLKPGGDKTVSSLFAPGGAGGVQQNVPARRWEEGMTLSEPSPIQNSNIYLHSMVFLFIYHSCVHLQNKQHGPYHLFKEFMDILLCHGWRHYVFIITHYNYKQFIR